MKKKEQAELLREADAKGGSARLGAYMRLTGPGWLQSALKLGAGSMSGALYLGVLSGFSLLWLQPMAMLLGIIILSTIGYVVMSSGERPFKAINEHISPLLGWGWAMAALMASVLWAVPQYSLAFGVVQQNLLPGVFGIAGVFTEFWGKLIVSLILFGICTAVAWSFGSGKRGVVVFDIAVKLMVFMIVLCFIGVVFRLALISGDQGLDWAAIFRGFIPDFSLFYSPAETFEPLLSSVTAEARAYWEGLLVRRQRDVIVASAAGAAGVNGTFLYAYTLVRRRWGKEFRGFSRFDLLFGMFIPFSIAVTCIVIAGAHQFHTEQQPGLLQPASVGEAPLPQQEQEYQRLLEGRILYYSGADVSEEYVAQQVAQLEPEEKHLAATLVTRDAHGLAYSLEPLTGPIFAHYIFGLGVLGMCLSSIAMQMLVCGFVVCEVMGRPHEGWTFRIGSLAAAGSAFVPFFWTQAYFWLAIPTSVLAAILIPIAATTFFLMINSRPLLGKEMPWGWRRVVWNSLLSLALLAFTISATFMLWDRGGAWGIGAAIVFITAVFVERAMRKNRKPSQSEQDQTNGET